SPWVDVRLARTAFKLPRFVPVVVRTWPMSFWSDRGALFWPVSVGLTRNVARPEPDPVRNVSETLAWATSAYVPVAALPGKVYVALYRPTATSVATNACEVPLGPHRSVSIVAARMAPCPVTRT